ncbi:DUF3276 family protein [Candidatus Gottesmanbacteria bacterium]|nr:DUF3276 family protein [Candidatus Gottesmanbacteria bacterium]
MQDDKPIKSEMMRCGKRTYFFDVKVTQKGDKYLKITETRLMAEGEPRKRNMIMIFPEDIERFKSVFIQISELFTHER